MKFNPLTALALTLILTPAVVAQRRAKSIRSVDFKNFTYPVWLTIKAEIRPRRKQISLVNGKFEIQLRKDNNPILVELENVTYRDLTGDGVEEAIVTVGAMLYPHGSSGCTFIYKWQRNAPRLLWQYEFGGAAYGGLRRLGIESSSIIIEQYISNRSTAYCCPEKFRRLIYRWDGRRFKEVKSEQLANESKSAEFLGYP